MLCIGGTPDFLMDILTFIFLSILDNVVYTILGLLYGVWELLAKIDIFGGSSAGQQIYDQFSARIFTLLSIVMVFVFAYKLICYIVEPETKSGPTSAKGMVKSIVISVIMVILAPLVFKYMAMFQFHIVANNTIPAIVLGTNGGNKQISSGKGLSMVTLMSFYHPYEGDYNSFVVNPQGETCDDIIQTEHGGSLTMEMWGNKMKEWCVDEDSSPGEVTTAGELHELIGKEDGVEYYWFISTIAGGVVCYFLIQYCIAVGTRAVKIAFLEVIAPVPIFLRVWKMDYWNKWFGELKLTYGELFIRIAIISFVVFLCSLIPSFIQMIWEGTF